MNKVILMGRLTSDPELRQSQAGTASCKFTIACDRKYTDKNTGERQADFINCIAWKQTAEFVARYFSKGKMIAVEGSIRTGSYKDKKHQDVTHYTSDIYVDNVYFCGDKGNTQQAASQPVNNYGNLNDYEEIISDGECPF